MFVQKVQSSEPVLETTAHPMLIQGSFLIRKDIVMHLNVPEFLSFIPLSPRI